MFEAFWSACKRIFDLTVVPGTIAIVMFVLEVVLGVVSWVIAVVGDLLLSIMRWALNAVDVPDFTLDDSTFGSKFLDLADLVGLWEAVTVYFAFALVAFISRLLTLGTVGNR